MTDIEQSTNTPPENFIETVNDCPIRGFVAQGWEPVGKAFLQNFDRHGEIGAACAVCRGAEPLVDLYGGVRESASQWGPDTMACVHSTTKGISAVVMAMALSRGYFELDAPIASYWPEFGCNGKEAITARQIFDHSAGLPIIEQPITLDTLGDLDELADILSHQTPQWEPGSKHGYHGWTLGFYQNEILRRTDPGGRSIGQFLREEITDPLGIEFYIGLPDEVGDERVAPEIVGSRMFREFLVQSPKTLLGWIAPDWLGSRRVKLMRQMLNNPPDLGDIEAFHGRPVRSIEVPSGNGIGTARAMARIMGECATDGKALGLSKSIVGELERPHPQASSVPNDELLFKPSLFQMGFCKPGSHFDMGGRFNGYFAPGAGGNMCFADPDTGIGFGYALNRFGGYLWNDPRELALRDAVFACASA